MKRPSALLSRENIKLAVVAVFCLLLAWTGPSIAHGVHAKFAHNADKVDGKHAVGAGAGLTKAKGKLVAHNGRGRLPGRFLPGSVVTEPEQRSRTDKIITAHGSGGWQRDDSLPPASVSKNAIDTTASGDGYLLMDLAAPQSSDGSAYGLEKLEICYRGSADGFIAGTVVFASRLDTVPEFLVSDPSVRAGTTPTCYHLAVGTRATHGVNLSVLLAGGGTVDLYGVRAHWSRSSANVAPDGPIDRRGAPGAPRYGAGAE